MKWRIRDILGSTLLGLLLAGPVAALALVAMPEDWRGPAVPSAAALSCIALVAVLRHTREPPG